MTSDSRPDPVTHYRSSTELVVLSGPDFHLERENPDYVRPIEKGRRHDRRQEDIEYLREEHDKYFSGMVR